MIIRQILSYHLFETEKYSLTVASLVLVIIVIASSYFLLRLIKTIINRRASKSGTVDGRYLSILQLVKYVIWTITVAIALQTIGLNITFIVASSAALLVGLGFGLQNVFQDFIAGIILLAEGTIHVGDIVVVNGTVVKIKEISLRTCAVVTREDNIEIIPNHMFVQDSVLNWSHNLEPTRFSIHVGVSYSSNTREVEKILVECAKTCSDIIISEKYQPFVRFTDFGDSALLFELIFWSNNLFRIEQTKSNLRFKIMDAFNESGIVIPFKQVVIHKE